MLRAKLFTGRIQFNIEVVSPLLIKSGGSVGLSPIAPDMECIRTMRDGVSQVYIPGTSLKGVLRAHAARLVSRYDEAMFGNTQQAGRFFFADAYATTQSPKLDIRSNTKINPRSGAAAGGSLRSFEAIVSGKFSTHIDWINISISQLGLLLLVLNELNTQVISLGSGGSKGMGVVRISYDALTLSYPACLLQNDKLYSCSNHTYLDTHQVYGVGSLVSLEQQKKYGFFSADTTPIDIPYSQSPTGLGVQMSLTSEQQIIDIRTACLNKLVTVIGDNHA